MFLGPREFLSQNASSMMFKKTSRLPTRFVAPFSERVISSDASRYNTARRYPGRETIMEIRMENSRATRMTI
jgi:hypothetical protein